MNDPNGLVYFEGEYHLFFQYNPYGNEWGHMSWGHAISRDLVHWTQLPVAIPEANGIMIFSGSTVVDRDNSSGLCAAHGDNGPSCLVAIYTGFNGKTQNQNLAYSNDHGTTWTKYSGNPIIDLHLPDFRDPKVFWYAPSRKWVMVTALPPQHKVRFFASIDLIHWKTLSDFGPAGAVGGVWECPDLFELPVEGEPGKTRWVLSVNLNPGGVAGGSGDQYFVGRFDGKRFIDTNLRAKALWADYGKDFYASTSFSNMPGDRRVWIGWLGNWEYAARTPTGSWRGEQSIPRELKLKRLAHGIRLIQQPVADLHVLRTQRFSLEDVSEIVANRRLKSDAVAGTALEIEVEFDPVQSKEFGLNVRTGPSERTTIGVNAKKSLLFVDRSRSGKVSFSPLFPGRQTVPIDLTGGQLIKLHIYLDASSIEVFANGGERVISDLVFPARSSRGLEFYSTDGKARIAKLDVWKLQTSRRTHDSP